MQRILIVEDDRALGIGLHFDLEEENYAVDLVDTIDKAKTILEQKNFNLAILDVNLPDGDGFTLCRHLKSTYDIPVIFLTACDLEIDEMRGFELGADDYITKPFSMPLLRKRVAVVLKRYSKEVVENIYCDDYLIINFDKLTIEKDHSTIMLTLTESKLMKLFVANQGRVLTRQILLERLWDQNGNFVDEHALTVNINRLRSKIEDGTHKYIKTVYGMGYQWIGEKL